MFCTKCGTEMNDGDKFCRNCGTPTMNSSDTSGYYSGSNIAALAKSPDSVNNGHVKKKAKSNTALIIVLATIFVILAAIIVVVLVTKNNHNDNFEQDSAISQDYDDNEDDYLDAEEDDDDDDDDDDDTQETDSIELIFSTYDIYGNYYDQDFFAEHELTMINFWEPWCGPCVGELPELEELYNDYKSEGFAILGVFSTEDGAVDTVEDLGLTYPILYYSYEFDQFQSGYVPTTIFVDRSGHVVGETYVGAKSYDDWASIVEDLL